MHSGWPAVAGVVLVGVEAVPVEALLVVPGGAVVALERPDGGAVAVLTIVVPPAPQAPSVTAQRRAARAARGARIRDIFVGRGPFPCLPTGSVDAMPEPARPPGADVGRRPRRKIDWELIACGWAGHVLVGTDAAELRPQDSLVAREAAGVRWHRCLRCDSWVALPPPDAPTAEHPPERDEIQVPLRGKALRDRVVLRLIAVDRVVHFTILVLLGLAVLAIAANEHSLRATFYRVVSDLQNGVGGGIVQNTHVGIVGEFNKLFSLRSGSLHTVGLALIAYGLLEGVEAIGLWFTRRWAEYLTFLATTVLLPLEVYELTESITALKVIGFLINLAVVVYLLFAKRLFGLRGGGRVDEAERARAMSWETIAHATPEWTPAGTTPAGTTPAGTAVAG